MKSWREEVNLSRFIGLPHCERNAGGGGWGEGQQNDAAGGLVPDAQPTGSEGGCNRVSQALGRNDPATTHRQRPHPPPQSWMCRHPPQRRPPHALRPPPPPSGTLDIASLMSHPGWGRILLGVAGALLVSRI